MTITEFPSIVISAENLGWAMKLREVSAHNLRAEDETRLPVDETRDSLSAGW